MLLRLVSKCSHARATQSVSGPPVLKKEDVVSPLDPSDPSGATALSKWLALEAAVVKLSGRLTACALKDIDSEIESGMRTIMEVTDAARICWYTLPEGVGRFVRTHSVAEPDTPPSP